jgi:hypothetical protein
VFVIYRDMDARRSLYMLAKELKQHHPDLAVAKASLEKWSQQHQWAERITQHEGAQKAQLQLAAAGLQYPALSPDFDEVAKLTSAAPWRSRRP